MNSSNPKVTAYSQYVFSNLPQCVWQGRGIYTYDELAGLVGLKPTGNFRRRVKQLVALGKLDAVAVFTARGGIETRFQRLSAPISEEGIPF